MAVNRRALLRFIAAIAAAFASLGSRVLAACTVTPRRTAGPFWVDERLQRSDLRTDPSDRTVRPGVPLALALTVQRADADCAPAPGVTVDVWHCDADGRYSDEASNGTAGQKFLRGYQVTDAAGAVHFTTIFPGWYPGRTVHIHVRVRAFAGAADSAERASDDAAPTVDFATQLFFDDAAADRIFARAPYDARRRRDTTNAEDGLYDPATRLTLASDGADGWVATFTVGLNGIPAAPATDRTRS